MMMHVIGPTPDSMDADASSVMMSPEASAPVALVAITILSDCGFVPSATEAAPTVTTVCAVLMVVDSTASDVAVGAVGATVV